MKTWLQLAQEQSKTFELAVPLIIGETYTISMNSNEPFMISVGDVFVGETVDGSLEFIATNSGDVMITSYNDISMEFEIKLEKGNMVTDWTPAPEDIQVELDDVIITTQENSSAITQTQSSIAQEIIERTSQGELILDQTSSLVQQTVDSFDVIFNKIEADQSLTNDEVELIQSYFRINENGVIIGKSDSAIEFFAENNRVGFRENGNDIAYWEEGTMHVDRLIAVTTIMVGYHLTEKYDSPVDGGMKTTIVRVGD